MKIKAAYFIESPDFEIATEDGLSSTFNLQVVAETEDGRKFTHFKTYARWSNIRACEFANEVEARGAIDPQYWTEGTSWDQYAEAQTYEEEKAERIFNYGAGA